MKKNKKIKNPFAETQEPFEVPSLCWRLALPGRGVQHLPAPQPRAALCSPAKAAFKRHRSKQARKKKKKKHTHTHPRFFPLPSFKLILLSLSSFVSSNVAQLLAHLRAQGAPTQSPAAWFGSLHPEQSTEIALQPWLPTPILTSYGPQKAFQ